MDEIKRSDVTALIIVQKLENKTTHEALQRYSCAKTWHKKLFLGNTRNRKEVKEDMEAAETLGDKKI